MPRLRSALMMTTPEHEPHEHYENPNTASLSIARRAVCATFGADSHYSVRSPGHATVESFAA